MYRTCARYTTGTYYTIGRVPVVPASTRRSSKHTLLVRDSLLFCMCMLCVFYCARSVSSLGGRGRREVGALRIAYFGIAYFGIAYFGIAYFEIAYFGIAYLAVDWLPLNKYFY
jgi:hypothetical protein